MHAMPESTPVPEPPTRACAHINMHNQTQRAQRTHGVPSCPTPRTRPENQGNQQTKEHPNKARLRANICIALQNVNGVTAPSENMNYKEKWKTISDTMHAEKIAILVIQESHLNQSMTENLSKIFEKNLKILNSANPDSPRALAGVGFIINKQLIDPDKMEMYKLVLGRAAMLKIRQLKTCMAAILNIYTPNKWNQHPIFWARTLTERQSKSLPILDFTLGDFNMTKDTIDRMPPKLDDEIAIATLRDVRHEWDMRDTWRWANPMESMFTYRAQMHNEQIQARLDHIYISKKAKPFTFDWEIKESPIPTDHTMVSVRYAPREALYIGKGHWMLPLSLLHNKNLLERVAERGTKFMADTTRDQIEQMDQWIANIQTHWETYSKSIPKIVKEIAKECYHKVTS